MRIALAIAGALLAAPALAEMRPVPRPAPDVVVMSSRGVLARPAATPAPETSLRAIARPDPRAVAARAVAAVLRTPFARIDTDGSVALSFRPRLREAELIPVGDSRPRPLEGGGGGICGRNSIKGEAIAPVDGPGACGIPDAVRITQVSGLALSRATRMDCTTARALDDWAAGAVRPVVGGRGGGAVALDVAAGYACRGRNNRSGAKLSEHSFGHAIDISGIRLADGGRITVLGDWGSGDRGEVLRRLHQMACGTFGTVLGPGSDGYHRDHFHLDTARYRSGSYCR